MNKILSLLGAALIFSSYNSWATPAPQPQTQPQPAEAKEEKFVNPIFYKRLSAVSRSSQTTYLTPTSRRLPDPILYEESDEKWITDPCVLLENKEDYIVIKCDYRYGRKVREPIYKYKLQECVTYNDQGKCTKRYVKEYWYDNDGEIFGESLFTVKPD